MIENSLLEDGELLSPKNDFLFKYIFADPNNKDILEDFLKSILTIPEQEYKKITIVDPNLLRRHKKGKLGILDIRVETTSGYAIDIELQIEPFMGMEQRVIWYNSKLLAEQAIKGQKYHTLKKVISVVITNYLLRPKDEGYHNIFHLMNTVTKKSFCDILEIVTLELPKVAMRDNIRRNPREEKLIRWLRFFKAKTREEYMTIAKGYPLIWRAFELVAQASGNEKQRKLYQQRERDWMDYQLRMSGAYTEGEQRANEKWQSVVAEKDAKWQGVVAEKDTALAEKDAENEKLRQMLAELQSK
jgi:predicted transposase/invertase (TIGR01784 family)